VLDYVFRLLAYEYLDREDLVHVPDPNKRPHHEEAQEAMQHELSQVRITAPQTPQPKPKAAAPALTPSPMAVTSQNSAELKKLLGTSADAPACRNCGNITLRNGTCYMCPNCGTTTGCS